MPRVACYLDLFLFSFLVRSLSVRHQSAANNCPKLSYRVLKRRDQINYLIVIMTKGKRKRGGQVKTTIDRSAVVTINNYWTRLSKIS